LEEIKIDLSAYQLMLVNPGIHINTGWAFSQLKNFSAKKNIKEIIQQPIETWKHDLQNDFEGPAFDKHPEIKMIKEKLYEQGAVYAAMSGSGSSVFSLHEKKSSVKNIFPASYFTTILPL
jgi:4-diphosphocytidyl-2-C-methyl-D-erythritol kinase